MALSLHRQLVRTHQIIQCLQQRTHDRGLATGRRLHQEYRSSRASSSNEAFARTDARPTRQNRNRSSNSYDTELNSSGGRGRARDFANRSPSVRNWHDVNVTVNGNAHSLAAVALRDLCACPQCVDPSTKQKLFYTPDIPKQIEADTVSQGSNSVTITWKNDVPGYGSDHNTEIPLDMLQRILETGQPEIVLPVLRRSLWDASTYAKETEDFTYDSYMQDDSVLLKAAKQLHTHGLMFVKNVPESEESVVNLAERIGPLKTTFYGKTWDVRSVPDAKNVAYTSQNLGFHMDLMYMEQPPHLQLLHCIRSSSAGGASLFCDSFKTVQEIADSDEGTFAALANFPAQFHYDHPGENYYHQSRTVIEQKPVQGRTINFPNWTALLNARRKSPDIQWTQDLNVMDFVSSVAWSPPFQGPFRLRGDPRNADSTPNPELAGEAYNRSVTRWHRAASKFNKLIHREDHIHERLMKPGECVMFDNRRVLHARRAFDVGDVGKERWLKGAYIDQDPYLSKLKILREKLEV
ncbi:Putative TauD/TfdA-like domain, gamma-butyrobetaine hydroxylase-like, GBBH-like domain superfamily [Septoria linicola]|uniref:TauD/TfdA-like domain, gamma-butyrobetaine hydroxylase-like, GBBH-like domain superfamily n=1 Tax=Septoria linicola TaxID=215465 RepID=A0A9Q9EFM1_9PEZI|nr:putative TauD/TfdA-like domain, gamma-butyrobetaine hydroxylase-like, GBBH-like domain superfamily [Septoria linicola]USW47822.1 Putative TauD/TfdA-like domain, gamma-butyrobetaine hydroxylase-like, GBBH-like domain superfamily [Septoria linicola]